MIYDRDDLSNPDYEYWAKMESWTLDEANMLLHGFMPFAEAEKSDPVIACGKTVMGAKREDQLANYMKDFEEGLSFEEQVEFDMTSELIGRAVGTGALRLSESRIYPSDLVKWAVARKQPLPERLIEAVKKYHPSEFEEPARPDKDKDLEEPPLSGEERRELGRLKREKETWRRAIEAAIHASFFCKGKKITRAKLTVELHKFDLPETTFKVIWEHLRNRGLTAPAGRPSKKKEENP